MFLSHRVLLKEHKLRIIPTPVGVEDQQAYVQTLSEKNRELAEIRDALDHSNQELIQRNSDLAELNQRLQEQSRLYQSLRINLDHLVELLKAGQAIGSSLSVDQVHRAMVAAALRLFDVPACRLVIGPQRRYGGRTHCPGNAPRVAGFFPIRRSLGKCARLCVVRSKCARHLLSKRTTMFTIARRWAPSWCAAKCLGTLEIYAQDARLHHSETTTLLAYLCSEASIALDNAYLYHEVQVQGNQLRSFVENVITTEEQESRRLAFDLHDGLVQLVVASYQTFADRAGRAIPRPRIGGARDRAGGAAIAAGHL